MSAGPTVEGLLKDAADRLSAAGVPGARSDARRLMIWALGLQDGAVLEAQDDRPLSDDHVARFRDAVTERVNRRPFSQITGRRSFWTHEFLVTGDVLDPRPETETLVSAALDAHFHRLLDLGTGSGCILLSLLAERSGAQGMGVDMSKEALAVARKNASRLGVQDRATFCCSDWFSHVEGRFDLIVSNPPYISAQEMETLAPEVADWEPRVALTDERDGLTAYRSIAREVDSYLEPGGRLMVEVGATQGADVCAVFAAAGLGRAQVLQDLDGRDRVVAWRKAKGA
ncbi:MAG: peptide chain release factor N(5)-glutamine methyltransferase [Pseudomonadota bacterium]